MLQFLLLVALAQPAVLSRDFSGLDPGQGPMAISDKDALGMPAPQCADRKQERRAMEQRIKGWTPECVVKPKRRDRDRLDQDKPRP